MKAPPRLYVENLPKEGESLTLPREAAHYVATVMRRRVGDDLRLFDGVNGEWMARISHVERKDVRLVIGPQSRAFAAVPDLILLFAPVKKTRAEFIVEKATELGARALAQVQTARTNARPLRYERMELIAREAAEQTERLDLPQILAHTPLDEVLKTWDEGRPLIFCDEAGDEDDAPWGGASGRALPMASALQKAGCAGQKAAILIGPEGGFTPDERRDLRARDNVLAVSLGPRILRADTAALAALTLWQAHCGDWQNQ